MQLADLYFEKCNYSEAMKIYKELHIFSQVEKCYENMILKDSNNPKVREEYGDFFLEIGLYEKSNYEYYQAISLHGK
jgi:hypothetical protein